MAGSVESVESVKEETKTPQGQISYWLGCLKAYEKDYSSWVSECNRIVDKYRAKGTVRNLRDMVLSSEARFNVLWSNVQILLPSIYARTPKPDVVKRNGDRDHISKMVCSVLERVLAYEMDEFDFDEVQLAVVLDYLLCGRGVSRVVYEPKFQVDPATGLEVKTYECTKLKYIHRNDFRHSPGRTWAEVTWVAFRTYESYDSLVTMLGEELAKQIPLDSSPDKKDLSVGTEPTDKVKRAKIWEIWDKDTKKVYWVSEGYPKILKEQDDPLGLKDFFPCPKPLFATVTTDSLIPVPDYILYQTHAVTLDVIQQRLGALLDAARANGCYNAAFGTDLSSILKNSDGKMTPIQNYGDLTKAGGLQGVMEFVPIQQFMIVLDMLNNAGDRELQKVYEITGISDIIRGASDPNETAKAQQIKGKYGTLRISSRQGAQQEHAKGGIALMGEVICNFFDPERIRAISGYDSMLDANLQPPQVDPNNPQAPLPPDEWTQIVGEMQNSVLRNYRIDIETDSTIEVDVQEEKQAWNEFVQVLTGFGKDAIGAIQTAPALAPIFKETLVAMSRVYKASSSLEEIIDTSFDTWIQQLNQPPPEPPPDPAVQVQQMKSQVDMEKLKIDQLRVQGTLDIKKYQLDTKVQHDAQKMEAEFEKFKQTTEVEIAKLQNQVSSEKAKLESMMAVEKAKIDSMLIVEKTKAESLLLQAQMNQESSKSEKEEKKSEKSEKAQAPVVNVHIDGKKRSKHVIQRDPQTGLMTGVVGEEESAGE